MNQNTSHDWIASIKFTADGLIPAIAQDNESGRILMMAWMNAESLQLTAKNKKAVYFSRSRQKLWHKGETSGHTQLVHNIYLDCDADVIVLKVTQLGDIACHTGRQSCFYRELDLSTDTPTWQTIDAVIKDPSDIYGNHAHTAKVASDTNPQQLIEQTDVLQHLDTILEDRKTASADSSYVASLYHKGLNKILEKVGEESVESIIAAKDYQTALDAAKLNASADTENSLADYKQDFIYEVADVWFHTLVTLRWFNIRSDDILAELSSRFGLSGLEEKANRNK